MAAPALINELRSAAATLRGPAGTATDRISAELIERAANALAGAQRAPLPATAVIALLPIMQDGWSLEDFATWSIRAAERAHGITGNSGKVSLRPSWEEAPTWAQFLAMDSDGDWFWFEHQPYRERFSGWDGWDVEGGAMTKANPTQGASIHVGWEDTLQARPAATEGPA